MNADTASVMGCPRAAMGHSCHLRLPRLHCTQVPALLPALQGLVYAHFVNGKTEW